MVKEELRLKEIIDLLEPGAGRRLWFGGATVLGCLRGVTHGHAAWKPAPGRHSIWEFALHAAYWKYAVRRNLEGSSVGGFPRSPANWPAAPHAADARAWKRDRLLLRSEHEMLVAAVRQFDPRRLDDRVPGSRSYRYMDLLNGVVMHDAYHVGQIQLMKRLHREGVNKPGRAGSR